MCFFLSGIRKCDGRLGSESLGPRRACGAGGGGSNKQSVATVAKVSERRKTQGKHEKHEHDKAHRPGRRESLTKSEARKSRSLQSAPWTWGEIANAAVLTALVGGIVAYWTATFVLNWL